MANTLSKWGRATLGAIAAEAGQIVAAIAWVAIYSHIINPGQPLSMYQAHAQLSGPWVSIFAGFPIFYAASRWIAKSTSTALMLFGIFVAIDLALLLGMSESLADAPIALFAASYATKLLACYLGGRAADRSVPSHLSNP